MDFTRGHWRREEGAVRGAGWWESVTVTWSPVAPAPERRPALLLRALAAAADVIAPSVVNLAAAGALRLVERQRRARPALPSPGRMTEGRCGGANSRRRASPGPLRLVLSFCALGPIRRPVRRKSKQPQASSRCFTGAWCTGTM